jgi:hypothetical protein
MWVVNNQTPFAAERGWARDRDGAEVWLVAVKATFLIAPDGRCEVAPEQQPVDLAPRYRGAPAASSLIADSDLMLCKKTTDILLEGHAYAPGKVPVPQVDVSMRVGGFQKAIRVYGNRHWKVGLFGLKPGPPDPFARMPLTYEHAFGGADPAEPERDWDLRNPVGVGYASHPDSLGGWRLPNLEDPGHLISSPKDRPPPACFGPIAPHWSPRRKYGGTYDDRWKEERKPLVPEDLDDRFYQCAPPDQQAPEFLRGGEVVELYNLSPAGPVRFALPRVVLGFETHFADGSRERHRATLHTVRLEPDAPRVVLVWHTSLRCHAKVNKLRVTDVTRKRIVAPPARRTGAKR